MENSMNTLTSWLRRYNNDPSTIIETLSNDMVTANYDTLSNYDFGLGRNILHIAVERNHPTIIRHLINVLPAQAMMELLNKKNKYGMTAIHYAADYNRHEILTEILSSVRAAGFSTLQLLLTPYSNGWTAAHWAARGDNYQVLESMLESLTNSDERLQLLTSGESGVSVLHIAAFKNSVQTVRSIQKYMTGDLSYQLMKAQTNNRSCTALHWAAYNNNTEVVRTLMDPLTDEQKLEMLEMRDYEGHTAKEVAVSKGHTEVSDLLEEITTTVMISMIKKATDQAERLILLERLRLNQPLSTQQIQELFPHSNRYVIPCSQKVTRQHGFILYNKHDRPGADEEANNLSGALQDAGCDVIKQSWSCVRELQTLIINGLQPIRSSCSFLMVCLMSHGSMGCLQGEDGEEIAINTILKLLTENLPEHIPLVILIQACAGSRYGIKLQSTAHTDPAVATSISMEDRKVDLVRSHTLLLQASSTGEPAYRGIYTGCIANQIKQANDTISLPGMEVEARIQMEKEHKHGQVPKKTDTLIRHLILPGRSAQH